MTSYYSTSEFKSGLKVIMSGDPFTIVENEFVKPGKGQAFNRVKLRNLKTDRVIEKTFKSGETIEAADVMDIEMQFLYSDGEVLHFMNQKTYEQVEVSSKVCGEAMKWLKEEDICLLILWNGAAISVQAPNFVNLTVVETDPGLKGDTSGGGIKPATLDTGAVVRVPLFVQIDDVIKIDTRSGEYVSRVKA